MMQPENPFPPERPNASQNPPNPAPTPPPFTVDSANVSTVYTNFCQVTFLPEELILDFGLNMQMGPSANQPIKLTHRVVMNYYTAKRLLHGLHMAVGRFEQTFGALELDVQKRAKPPGASGVNPEARRPDGERPQ